MFAATAIVEQTIDGGEGAGRGQWPFQARHLVVCRSNSDGLPRSDCVLVIPRCYPCEPFVRADEDGQKAGTIEHVRREVGVWTVVRVVFLSRVRGCARDGHTMQAHGA